LESQKSVSEFERLLERDAAELEKARAAFSEQVELARTRVAELSGLLSRCDPERAEGWAMAENLFRGFLLMKPNLDAARARINLLGSQVEATKILLESLKAK